MDSICGGFVNIQRGKFSITQFNPKIWNTLRFGIWDGGGDELILTLLEYSKYSDTIFRVIKHDGMTAEALEFFKKDTRPGTVYITPSVHASIASSLPQNFKVLYSAWRPSYLVYSPPPPMVTHSIQKVCFRGQGCVPIREQLFEEFKDHPLVDFKLTKGTWHPEFKNDPNRLTHEEQRKYRGLVSVEGSGHPSNLEWVLGSGCVPVVHCTFLTGLQMDMRPWVHYVPFTDEGVRWIFDNPEKADTIIMNAVQLHKEIKLHVHKQMASLVTNEPHRR